MQYVILGVYVVSLEQIAILESDDCIINKYINLIRGKGKKKSIQRHATQPAQASFPFKKINKLGGGGQMQKKRRREVTQPGKNRRGGVK